MSKPDLEVRLGGGLASWVDLVRRHHVAVLLLATLVTAGALTLVATRLGVDADSDGMFSEDLPFRRLSDARDRAFPVLDDTLLVLVEADTPDRARDAAKRLASRLRQDEARFLSVFHPAGDPFFERHSLLYLDIEELEEFADRLAEVQPYLAELARDGSLRGLFGMLELAVEALQSGDARGFDLEWVFDRIDLAVKLSRSGGLHQLSWEEMIRGRPSTPEDRRQVLVVKPVVDFSDVSPAREALRGLAEAEEGLGLSAGGPVRVRVTGNLALATEEMTVVRRQAGLAGIASFVLVGCILFAGLRSSRLVGATLVTLLVGLVCSAAFAAVAIGNLNVISVSFAVLFVGLAVDFGIHFCMRYAELCSNARPHEVALREAARDVGPSLLLCAVTTAIGFFAFVPTDYTAVAELGVISGAGMFISLAATLTLLPALLSLGAGRSRTVPLARSFVLPLPSFPVRHRRAVRLVALGVGACSIALLPRARFDTNPVNLRDPGSPAVVAFRDLVSGNRFSPWTIDVLSPDLDSARRVAARLRELDAVDRVVTIADYVPEAQEEKLAVLEDIALFMAPAPDTDESPPSPIELLGSVGSLARSLDGLAQEEGDSPLGRSARRLGETLFAVAQGPEDDPQRDALVMGLEESLLGSFPERLRLLQLALQAGPVEREDLPAALAERMVGVDGQIRIRVFPVADLNDEAAFAGFVDDVQGLVPEAAGSAVSIVESARTVVRSLQQAFLAATAVIAVLLIFLWRRLRDAGAVLLPLCLAAVLTGAASVLAGISFNFADVIVLPLLLGIGVDSGIHLVHRHRIGHPDQPDVLHTSTARAVLYSAFTTIASFGSLAFASHRGLGSLGQLLAIGVALTLLCNLLVLPALIPEQSRRDP